MTDLGPRRPDDRGNLADYVLRWTAGNVGAQEVPIRQLPFSIGRSPQASLSLGGGLGEVSGMHLRLSEIGGCLCVEDLNSTNGTYLNERRVQAPVRVSPTDVIGLGKNGPRFRVVLVEAVTRPAVPPRPVSTPVTHSGPTGLSNGAAPKAPPAAPPPLPEEPGPEAVGAEAPRLPKSRSVSLDTMMHHLEEVRGVERRRTSRLLAVTILSLLAVGGGLWWFLREPGNIQQVAARYHGSIWKVCKKKTFPSGGESKTEYTSIGTAWTVASGRLATNAHVASAVSDLEPGASVVARVIRDGQTVEVTIQGARSHPDYSAFRAALAKYRPIIDGRPMGAKGQFDVAVLEVAEPDRSFLGDPLPIARTTVLAANLSEPLCYLGYPSENKDVDPASASIFCLVGPCAHLTDAYFGAASFEGVDGLIGVQMPGAGGASGGPILNARGQVVALLAAGDTVATPSARVSDGMCYGPSAALLLELLEAPALSREPRITARMREMFRSSVQEEGFLSWVKTVLAKDGMKLAPSEDGDRTWDLEAMALRSLRVDSSVAHVVLIVPEGDPADFEVASATGEEVQGLVHGRALVLREMEGGGEHSVSIANGTEPSRLKVRLMKIVKE